MNKKASVGLWEGGAAILVLLCQFFFLKAFAIEANVSGRVFTDTYFSTQGVTAKTFQQQNLSAWLQGDIKFSERFSLRGVYQGDYFDATNSHLSAGYTTSTLRSALREFYWEYTRGGFSIREGKQIIVWGKSDGLNPTDYFSAKDYSFLNPDDEARRLAGTAVNSQWTPDGGNSPWTFQLVTQFVMPQGKALIPASAVPTGVVINDPERRGVNFDNTEYSFKVSYGGVGWDGALSFFRGYNHQPQFVEVSRAGAIILQQNFSRVFAVGIDGSKSWSKWVGRFEGAYFKTENDEATHALTIPSHLDFVGGLERPLGDDWRVHGQILIRYFPNYKSADDETDLINRQVARFNALMLQYQDKTRPSASLRLAYEPSDSDFGADIFFIYSTASGDYLWRPQLRYKPIDNLKLLIGADNYGGDATKPLGSLKPYNSIYFEAKYYF